MCSVPIRNGGDGYMDVGGYRRVRGRAFLSCVRAVKPGSRGGDLHVDSWPAGPAGKHEEAAGGRRHGHTRAPDGHLPSGGHCLATQPVTSTSSVTIPAERQRLIAPSAQASASLILLHVISPSVDRLLSTARTRVLCAGVQTATDHTFPLPDRVIIWPGSGTSQLRTDINSHDSDMNPHSFSRNYLAGGQSSGLDRLIHDGNFNRPAVHGNGEAYVYGNGLHPKNTENRSNGGEGSRSGVYPSAGPTGKRGSRACVACRKGKNRCEPDTSGTSQSCRRCLLNGTNCVFEKAERRETRNRNDSISDLWTGEAEGRVSTLEKSVQALANGQTQIQSALQQILSILPVAGASMATPGSVPPLMSHSDSSSLTPIANLFQSSTTPPAVFSTTSPVIQSAQRGTGHLDCVKSPPNANAGSHLNGPGPRPEDEQPKIWPKLPGFAPPDHRFGTYGIIPLESAPPSPSEPKRSSRSPSAHSDSSDGAVPLVAPIQALQTLANAADRAAALANHPELPSDEIQTDDSASRRPSEEANDICTSGGERGRSRKRKRGALDAKQIHLRVRRQTKPDPTPRNPFPDVVTKGLVSDAEARELWNIFFTGCHYFVPLWDRSYDVYESFIERTPFSTNGMLAVAAKIRAGNGHLGQTFHRCLEEGQGIARSTLFGPIVRKEAVMAMLILSVWSQYGWLPVGHALRMGLDINLHRALDKLADGDEARTEAEERDLVVSARIWLNCYLHEHLSSLGTGKPLMLRDDSSVRAARVLLSHSMMSHTDASLVARVEMVNLRIRVMEHLTPLHGKIDSSTISFVRNIFKDMENWYTEWRAVHEEKYDEDSVLLCLLDVELAHAELWTVCVALRGCQWDKLRPDQRELAFQAKDAALKCIKVYLHSRNFRRHLKYATHDQLATVAFAAVFLLKIAMLYPTAISLPALTAQVSGIAHVLSTECFAERYALTLKLMLANFRRKTGAASTVPGTPRVPPSFSETLPANPANGSEAVGNLDGGLQSLLSLPPMTEGVPGGVGSEGWPLFGESSEGFAWPNEFSPSNLPTWLQDNSFTDLGLPVDGSDSLFLPLELANMFLPSGTTSSATYQFALPDSADVGAEAW